MRLKRDTLFSKKKRDLYDVIIRSKCTYDLTVFMLYVKDLVNTSTVFEEVDSHSIVTKHAEHLEVSCSQMTGGFENLIQMIMLTTITFKRYPFTILVYSV